jgi:hypothetical protein
MADNPVAFATDWHRVTFHDKLERAVWVSHVVDRDPAQIPFMLDHGLLVRQRLSVFID